jgi:hypothetical protein
MTPPTCDHERAVLRAVATGAWSDQLRQHLGGCPACSDAALVASVLAREAEELDPGPPLPDPSVIWLRARLEQRRHTARRATRIIDVFQVVAATAGVAATAALAPWLWPRLRDWLGAARASFEGSLPAAAELGQPSVVLLVSACLVLLLVATGYYESWVED